jgi:hypothetical protein
MRLDPIAIRIDDKGGVTAGALVGAQAGLAVVTPAALERGGVESVNAARPRRGEAEASGFGVAGSRCRSAQIVVDDLAEP